MVLEHRWIIRSSQLRWRSEMSKPVVIEIRHSGEVIIFQVINGFLVANLDADRGRTGRETHMPTTLKQRNGALE